MSNLSRNPQYINKYIWYFEEPSGIHVVVEVHEIKPDGTIGPYTQSLQFKIPWGKLKKSLARKLEDKSKAKKMKT